MDIPLKIMFFYLFVYAAHISLFQQMNMYLQWLPFENGQSPFYVVNEVTFKGQKPSLEFC